MRFIVVSIFCGFFSLQNAFANSIDVRVTGVKDDVDYSGKSTCDLEYSITNNSMGTVHYFSVNLDAWDDRGEKIDEVLGASIDNSKGFSRVPIAVGGTFRSKMTGGFKAKCKYIGKVKFVEIKPEYCNIRMLPEDADCFKMLRIGSTVPTIKVF